VTALVSNDLGDILENYADAIEGGNSYRGSGTVYKGIPGQYPNDEEIARDGLSITASGNGTTTTVVYASGDWPQSRWVKENTPGFWLVSGDDEHRKITAWDNTTKTFTVAPAFSEATATSDTFEIRQGFIQMKDGVDIEAKEYKSDFDRVFSLRITGPIIETGFYGRGCSQWEQTLELTLRLLKYYKETSIRKSVAANLAILKSGMMESEHREGAIVALIHNGAIDIDEDAHKAVGRLQFRLIYRLDSTFK